MNRNIKATYDGKHFSLTAEECNTVELISLCERGNREVQNFEYLGVI